MGHGVGASVFNGAFSTFLAVAAMAASQTYVFRVFFRQFFLVTLIGSIHGLIVLPVLLSLLGPNSSVMIEENQNDTDKNTNDETDRTNAIKMDPIDDENDNTEKNGIQPMNVEDATQPLTDENN